MENVKDKKTKRSSVDTTNVINKPEEKEDINELELAEREYASYIETVQQMFISNFVSKMFSDGIVKDVSAEDLQKYLSSPEKYHTQIEKLATYYYISNGDVYQLFDLTKILPTLNHSIIAEDKSSKSYEKNVVSLNRLLNNKIKHKQLTRDIISQVITAGTLTGIWLGDKKKPYLYIFDDVEYAFPAYRREGEWVVWVDMAWFDTMTKIEREQELINLSPYITLDDYNKYKSNPIDLQYVELPVERSVVVRTHTVKRNQRLGVSWATQGLYDILHKKKLKDMELTVANKIINSVAIMTIGNEKNPNLQLNTSLKRKVFGGLKTALDKGNAQGVSCIALPEWARVDFPELKSDALDPSKFTTINSDIEQGTGVSGALKNGTGGTFASGNINFETVFKRIAVLLEDIESEVYGKLFNILMPSSQADNYRMVYDKQPPLTTKEKVEILLKLEAQGFSIKAITDCLGMDFNEFINQTLYEQKVMDLPNKVSPYQSSSTLSNKGQTPTGSVTENTGSNDVPSKK